MLGPQKNMPHKGVELDAALERIRNDPTIGEAKMGDLVGMYVCKFGLSEQQCLLAY